MSTQAEKATRFHQLHRAGDPLLLPNPWDIGSAKVLAEMGFQALATTSGGFAGTLGRRDGKVTRDEAIAHGSALSAAVDLPMSADLENGFAHDPAGVAETVELALGAGLAGCSIEDHSPGYPDPVYDVAQARDRVVAAAEVAHGGNVHLVITARAENYLYGRRDLADTINRLQAFEDAGADVLYAPGLTSLEEIRTVVSSVSRPVNVLALPGVPSVSELASVDVARISIGSGFARVAIGAMIRAGRELLDSGTYGFWDVGATGSEVVARALA